MTRVKCDGCGDEHECAKAGPAAGAPATGKSKRKLSPALAAQNEQRKRDAEARRSGGTGGASGGTATATGGGSGGGKKRSIVRELLGF